MLSPLAVAAMPTLPEPLLREPARTGVLRGLTCVAAVAGALTFSGCDKPGGPGGRGGPPPEEAEEQPTPVVSASLSRGNIEAGISSASTIEAEQSVTVHAESTGEVTQLDVEEGDEVEEGKLLARIDRGAQSSLLTRASTNLERAQDDYDKIKDLFNKGAASKQELDAARNTLDNAKLDRRDRRRDVSNTKVNAPFDGTLTERFVSEGGFVTTGQQMFSLVDFSTLVARVYVPEKELDRIAVGQEAEVVGKAAKGRKGTGTIKRIAPVVDAQTGTVKVTVSLPPEASGGTTGFLPGMYAEVSITTDRKADVLLLSKAALVRQDEQVFVFVVEEKEGELRATRKLVELGLEEPNQVEVLSGLEQTDEVILKGQSGLKDNGLIMRVDVSGRPVEGGPSLDSEQVEELAAAQTGTNTQ